MGPVCFLNLWLITQLESGLPLDFLVLLDSLVRSLQLNCAITMQKYANMQTVNGSEVLQVTAHTVLMLGAWHKAVWGTLYLLGTSLPGAFQLPTELEHLGPGGCWAVFIAALSTLGCRHTALLHSWVHLWEHPKPEMSFLPKDLYMRTVSFCWEQWLTVPSPVAVHQLKYFTLKFCLS